MLKRVNWGSLSRVREKRYGSSGRRTCGVGKEKVAMNIDQTIDDEVVEIVVLRLLISSRSQ